MNFYRRYLNRVARSAVVVHLKSGTSIKGLLHDVYRDVIVLRHADVATARAKDFVEVDGEQLVFKSDIDWIQLLEGEEAT